MSGSRRPPLSGLPRCKSNWSIQQRLDHYTDKSAGPEGCWLWRAQVTNRDRSEYGRLNLEGKHKLAHRLAWAEANGEPPPDVDVLHACDTPRCCNPAHLFLGNQADNNADRDRKGRQDCLRGEDHSQAKLNSHQVLAIRADPRSHPKVAADYGVTRQTVSMIKARKTWASLP